MPAIQLTDRDSSAGATDEGRALSRAAVAALGAPSILNTQPWRWRIGRDTADLRADRSRQVASIDPDGRLLTLSCGIALHYARTALLADGYDVEVSRLPDDGDPDLLATVRFAGRLSADAGRLSPDAGGLSADARRLSADAGLLSPDAGRLSAGAVAVSPGGLRDGRVPSGALRMFRAMAARRSDRRPFDARPVGDEALGRLRDAAEREGAHLHLPPDNVALAVAAGRAATVELDDPAYRADLLAWVGSSRDTRDGVPDLTAAPPAARPVPIRDFTATGPETGSLFDGPPLGDSAARYGVLFTDGDEPRDWLVAGEALSAVLLTATADGLSSSMLSDLVEVESSRNTLRDLLGHVGHPMLVVRVGYATDPGAAAVAPRRTADEVIEAEADPDGA